jgi:hypothetical protein
LKSDSSPSCELLPKSSTGTGFTPTTGRGVVAASLDVDLVDRNLITAIAKKRCGGFNEKAENVARIMIQKAGEYVGPTSTPLEKMLGLFLGILWFDSHAALLGLADLGGGVRADRAMKRLERMTLTLARVQKLRLPSVQVNIGQNQIINP